MNRILNDAKKNPGLFLKSQKLLLLTICFLVAISGFSQSPWVNKKGSFYGQLSTTFLSYNSIINDNYNDIIESEFTTNDITVGFFGDYSLTNKTAVIVDLPFKSVEHNGQSLSGLGDAKIKVKHQLADKIPFAVHYGYTAPLSERSGILRTGYKQHAAELGLSAGIGKSKYFTFGSLSYKYRTDIPDQVIFESEFGVSTEVADKVLFVIFRLDGALNTSSVEDLQGDETVLYHNNGEFVSPGLKFSYNVTKKFWINAGFFGAVHARKLGAAPTMNFGLAYNGAR